MVIEVLKDQKILGEQLFKVIVDGETIYNNCNYDELCQITIGDLDKYEEYKDIAEGLV